MVEITGFFRRASYFFNTLHSGKHIGMVCQIVQRNRASPMFVWYEIWWFVICTTRGRGIPDRPLVVAMIAAWICEWFLYSHRSVHDGPWKGRFTPSAGTPSRMTGFGGKHRTGESLLEWKKKYYQGQTFFQLFLIAHEANESNLNIINLPSKNKLQRSIKKN